MSYDNPFTGGIQDIVGRLRELEFSVAKVLQSTVTAIALLITLSVLVILWPTCGLVSVAEQVFRGLIRDTRSTMLQRETVLEQTPDAIAICIYAVPWLSFVVFLSPLVIFGMYVHLLMRWTEIDRRNGIPKIISLHLLLLTVGLVIFIIAALAIVGEERFLSFFE